MTIWLDNHLSPALADWISAEFAVPCVQVRQIGLARARDSEIFEAARKGARIFVTKDRDFAELVARRGPPPAIILLTCGNTSTSHLKGVLAGTFADAMKLMAAGEPIVEIGGR